jgi:hypothetical protein
VDGNLVSWLLIGLAAAASISGFMALRRDHELTRQAVDDGDLPAPIRAERHQMAYIATACVGAAIILWSIIAVWTGAWWPIILVLPLVYPGMVLAILAIWHSRATLWYRKYQLDRIMEGMPLRKWWDWRTG